MIYVANMKMMMKRKIERHQRRKEMLKNVISKLKGNEIEINHICFKK